MSGQIGTGLEAFIQLGLTTNPTLLDVVQQGREAILDYEPTDENPVRLGFRDIDGEFVGIEVYGYNANLLGTVLNLFALETANIEAGTNISLNSPLTEIIQDLLVYGKAYLNAEPVSYGNLDLITKGHLNTVLGDYLVLGGDTVQTPGKYSVMTFAEFEALPFKDSGTIYFTSGSPNPFSVTDIAITTGKTSAEMTVLYPDAGDGFEVKCPMISPLPRVYKKLDNGDWIYAEFQKA